MAGRPRKSRGELPQLRARRLALEPTCRRCWRPASEVRAIGQHEPGEQLEIETIFALCARCADEHPLDVDGLAEALRAAYAASGDVQLARAAAELAPRPGRGRRAIDDSLALERMETLLADPEQTVWGAALAVAEELGERQAQRRSVAVRLDGKCRRAREMGGG